MTNTIEKARQILLESTEYTTKVAYFVKEKDDYFVFFSWHDEHNPNFAFSMAVDKITGRVERISDCPVPIERYQIKQKFEDAKRETCIGSTHFDKHKNLVTA
ncbi:MAG: hypothetical protein FWG63_00245 [Defluviitaleaceae bacterium]|nr:hypothetical protein [Defluviitaleaceae bacterium]